MPGPKNGVNDQWGLASATGARAAAGPPFPLLASGDGGPPLIDEDGRLWVRPVGAAPPIPGFGTQWQLALSGGFNDAEIRGTVDPANQFILAQVAGEIEAASETDINYVQLFDVTGPPAPGSFPQVSIRIVGSQNYSWAPGQWLFPNGIRWAISTTPFIYTAGTTALGGASALGWESLP